ncbi:ClpXP protease specificity-enhancing factor SspB [Candidatus Neoehrlichia procyonis]|uniref:Stringent starvation B family protein n=1 Tax=Candidatus Neoehrlichia procyonis str. RAC413 TaxID=1359163 RepID=A0A0F3NPB0_9RICK|nr:ClpXP protease specificity-enhancing factor SspB [Candidatus Neoehrlichia lotoris]KJV68739.1 stringent starvation B family protein [Candidatus Neoehrlichia lotoris str. RAC413]
MNEIINYRLLIYNSMCNVIKEVFSTFAYKEPYKQVHVAVTLLTQYKGVVLPEYIKESYPENVTIIIQHQFRNLQVTSNDFSVILSFKGKEENVIVPFKSITKYVDLLANFSLDLSQYEDIHSQINEENKKNTNNTDNNKYPTISHTLQNNIIFIDSFRKN